MKQESSIKAVIFDIDGTLTTKNSWFEIAIAVGGTPEEDKEILRMYRSGIILSEEADTRLLAMWKRQGLATKENFRKIFESIPLRQDAADLVNYLKSKNIIVCLITGSMDMYAEIIAAKLGLINFYHNANLFWDENNHIKSFNYIVNQGEKKLEQLHDFCKKNNLKPKECVVIGDSENDYGLFKLTQKGIAVRTEYEDRVLEQLAWQVVDHLAEIKRFI